MKLSRYTLKNIDSSNVIIPDEAIFELPEKVLQFGTGVLLRGLPDYFIDKANRAGIFNGRIVVVKSTSQGDSSAFEKQDGLYTLCVRGLQEGISVQENIINSSISRVLSAQDEWEQILECAHNQNMQVIISNTTEVGIQLVNEDVRRHPPVSFPGKLLAFLLERFKAFDGSAQSGMVIIPTELILENGKKLESIVLELAHLNGLEDDFIEWLENSNHFCNSLVDRIVPGKPDHAIKNELEQRLGYTDELLIMSEAYRLWAIEGDDFIRSILSFFQTDEGVVISTDINQFRELKLRVLNGTHTLSCGVAFLSGIKTVKEAMEDEQVSSFLKDLMMLEIAPSIPYDLPPGAAEAFGHKVLDRFRNPEIEHHWINITVQYTSKMKMRNVPLLLNFYEKKEEVPSRIAFGFAAYILFMRVVKHQGNDYSGIFEGKEYPIKDDKASLYFNLWQKADADEVVNAVLQDVSLWDADLSVLPGFADAVTAYLQAIQQEGMKKAMQELQSTKIYA